MDYLKGSEKKQVIYSEYCKYRNLYEQLINTPEMRLARSIKYNIESILKQKESKE